MKDKKKPQKFYWHANTSSGGTLTLSLDYEGELTKAQKESALADGIRACAEMMQEKGYIPHNATIMSSGDMARIYGSSRQYWEKLLNEGKIHYKETSAGRITTDLWVEGYLKDKENVNKYVRDVRTVLDIIKKSGKDRGSVICPVCQESRFEYAVNANSNTNGVCRACTFYVHTTN